jgi:uncharacterized SAM-binding protein YcdF (DUF218 family)
MRKNSSTSYKSRIFRFVGIILLIGLITSALSFLAIRSEWNSTIEEPSSIDLLIVLGAGVWGDQPSPQLKLRLQTAAKIFEENPKMQVLVSGGQGHDEWISEAEAMHNYLVQLDVPSESILLEDQSTSTVENLTFSKTIIDSLEIESNESELFQIGIVTTEYHMYRAKMLAKRFGINAGGESAPNVPIIIVKNTLREIVAVIKDTILR